ncbi:MAG: hypothetical protein JW871_04210 [Endomicrobiales bacterium]|nr:hypothetical protein [Endomicrobiales bacterium]
MRKFYIYILLITVFLGKFAICSADVLNINTDYRISGISYKNNDFDKETDDPVSYYIQRLNLSISGKFDSNIEIGSKITALGVVGGTRTVFNAALDQSVNPYPNTDFMPYIETAYLKLTNFAELPVNISVGKQNLEFGDGLVISDNGTGYFAFHVLGYYELLLPWEAQFFIAKLKDTLRVTSDQDLLGFIVDFKWKRHLFELGYFNNKDNAGSVYNQIQTKTAAKRFYSFRVGREEKLMEYQFEYVQQKGSMKKVDNTNVNINAHGYVISGKLIGEKTKLGKVTANALLAIATGDDNPNDTRDTSFTPDLTRKFDGLKRTGYGSLFAASPYDSFFDIPDSYSGINTLNVGADFSPWYAWTFGVNYYLFSASQGLPGFPTASGFERIFGAEYSLGIEMDLSVQYTHSKYVETKLSYNRYTPPETFSIKRNPATMYQFEISTKF